METSTSRLVDAQKHTGTCETGAKRCGTGNREKPNHLSQATKKGESHAWPVTDDHNVGESTLDEVAGRDHPHVQTHVEVRAEKNIARDEPDAHGNYWVKQQLADCFP